MLARRLAVRERGGGGVRRAGAALLERLGLEAELQGHEGCVNCLEWSQDGRILASASDDLHVILWDALQHKQLKKISTGHNGNIFSVKFLSRWLIATGAADYTVRAWDIAAGSEFPLLACHCHCNRVKRLAVAPDEPQLIWSAGEDGLIIQHDLRVSHTCNSDTPNVLINLLNHLGRYAEAKCVAVNPRRPHQLAVGANDFYVRLYDRRMIKLSRLNPRGLGNTDGISASRVMFERHNARASGAGKGDPEDNIPPQAVQYFAPGHLSSDAAEPAFPKKATTYVAFSPDGTELLVNLGSEQIYMFDVNTAQRPTLVKSYIIEYNNKPPQQQKNGTKNGTVEDHSNTPKEYVLPYDVRDIKEEANELVRKGLYWQALEAYNMAIARCPDCAVLYSNRAAALMRRHWAGDVYAAIRDCYKAIALDPTHVKSHFRLAKALMELRKAPEAHQCLLYFKDKFPRYANSHAVCLLQRDVDTALAGPRTIGNHQEDEDPHVTSPLERTLRAGALDYKHRFVGHCNTTTDIKETNFLSPCAQYIAAGSDDGSMFVWSVRTGNTVRCLRGDDSIVNCVQAHPATALVATSGIETVVRLWSPRPQDGQEERRLVSELHAVTAENQARMRSDPFEALLFNISLPDQDAPQHQNIHPPPSCRAS